MTRTVEQARDPRVDPKPGDWVKHVDGGGMYVFSVTDKAVKLNRLTEDRYTGSHWLKIGTFRKYAGVQGEER
jgi:hypothetical protein